MKICKIEFQVDEFLRDSKIEDLTKHLKHFKSLHPDFDFEIHAKENTTDVIEVKTIEMDEKAN